MGAHYSEIGETGSGETISSVWIQELNTVERLKFARQLTEIGRIDYEREQAGLNSEHVDGLGAPLHGFAKARWTWQRMGTPPSSYTNYTGFNLLLAGGKAIGVSTSKSMRAGETPILIARPSGSTQVDYWLEPSLRSDEQTNNVVASSVLYEGCREWQWGIYAPEYQPSKVKAFTKLGMVAIDADNYWLMTLEGSGVGGDSSVLYGKAPEGIEENEVIVNAMRTVHNEVSRLRLIDSPPYPD